MTKLLAELIKKVENLPPEIQDEIAKQILEDIENELRWRETLAQPQSELKKLAKKALEKSKVRYEKC
jgi:hypothetical protein